MDIIFGAETLVLLLLLLLLRLSLVIGMMREPAYRHRRSSLILRRRLGLGSPIDVLVIEMGIRVLRRRSEGHGTLAAGTVLLSSLSANERRRV